MAKNVQFLALTGAGISKASGIPTFQEMPELKEKLTVEYRSHQRRENFKKVLDQLRDTVTGHKPNAAHKALAKHDIPIVTMNVDGLHQKAGSGIVVECHGNAAENTVVLYGEKAAYDVAYNLLNMLSANAEVENKKKVLLVIGTSYQTQFAQEFVCRAMADNWKIVDIHEDAEHRVEQAIQKECALANGEKKRTLIVTKNDAGNIVIHKGE